MGTTVMATASEQRREKLTTMESCLNITPDIPCTKTKGRKTTTVVRVLAMIAAVTSPLPSIAAGSAPWPSSRRRKMFSRTTIALSTSMPTPRARPPRVMRLRVNPAKYSSAMVAMMETGMAVAMTSVLRTFRRKKSRTSMVRMPP